MFWYKMLYITSVIKLTKFLFLCKRATWWAGGIPPPKAKCKNFTAPFIFKIHFSTYVLCLYAVMGNWCSKIFDLTHSTSGVSCLRSNSKYPCGLATALVYADVRNRGSEGNILVPIVLICETSAGFLKSTTYCTVLHCVVSSHEDAK